MAESFLKFFLDPLNSLPGAITGKLKVEAKVGPVSAPWDLNFSASGNYVPSLPPPGGFLVKKVKLN